MRKLFSIILPVSLVLIMLCSCRAHNDVRRVLSAFMETEIVFPDDMEVYEDGRFSMAVLDSLHPVKMIIYYDSAGCSGCRISHLIEHEPLYAEAAEDGRYDVVTIFSPRQEELEDVRLQLVVQDFSFPVYVDTYGSFARMNGVIPSDARFHSFLIDGDGHPVMVGNPAESDPILEANVEALARGEELQLPCEVSKSHTCFVLGRDAHGNLINMTIKGMKNIFK